MAEKTKNNEVMMEGVPSEAVVTPSGNPDYFAGEINAFAWQEEERDTQRSGTTTIYRVPVNVQRQERKSEKDGKMYSNYAVAKRFATGRKNADGSDDFLEITFNLHPVANREMLYKSLSMIFGEETKKQLEIVRTERVRNVSGKEVKTYSYSAQVSGEDEILGELIVALRTVGEGDRAQFDTLIRILRHDGYVE